MALLKFVSLSVGSLMLLQGAYVNGDPSGTDATKNCLTAMNAARTQAGLSEFTATPTGGKGLLAANTDAMNKVCTALKTSQTAALPILETAASKGTGIYFVQQEEKCSAAVDQWKTGFSSFKSYTKEVPPAFKAAAADTDQVGTEAPYNSMGAVDFVALYTPKTSTTDCALVDCTNATAQLNLKALVCVIHPLALEDGQKPYNMEQWNGILKVFAPEALASSASAAVPTLLALAAAAVGVALM